jgi:hypothetical protein
LRGGPVGTCQRKPVMDLAMPVLRTGPDVAAARADREENHDPGGQRKRQVLTRELRLENEGAAIRERPPRCKVGDEDLATPGSGAFMYAACRYGPCS